MLQPTNMRVERKKMYGVPLIQNSHVSPPNNLISYGAVIIKGPVCIDYYRN